MAITKVSRNLLSTGVSDSSDATAITINSSEQVGIGTTSPNTLLHAATGSNGSGLIDVARFQNVGTTVNDGARIQLTAGTSTSGAGIGCLGDALNSAHLVLHAGGNTEQMRINSNGNVRVQNGNLEIGTDGKGIDFGSSSNAGGMTAEILDDYEEGIHVATIACGTSGTVTLNGAYSDLSYTKVGRLVTVTGFVIVSSVSSPVGYYTISLPFTAANLTDRAGDATVNIKHHYGNNAKPSDIVAFLPQNSSIFYVYRGDVGVTRSSTAAEELRASTQIMFTVTYNAA